MPVTGVTQEQRNVALPAALKSNLTVWLKAEDFTGTAWPNRGSAPAPSIIGGPAPTLMTYALNGRPVVRFAVNEGRIRGTGMFSNGATAVSLFYVGRMWGPNKGRMFSDASPTYNYLVGTHSTGEPVCFDGGWVGPQPAWGAIPSPWKVYGMTCATNFNPPPLGTSYFFVNQAPISVGSGNATTGHGSEYAISGVDDTTSETCDCEVAELLAWNRNLSGSESVAVDYLQRRWAL